MTDEKISKCLIKRNNEGDYIRLTRFMNNACIYRVMIQSVDFENDEATIRFIDNPPQGHSDNETAQCIIQNGLCHLEHVFEYEPNVLALSLEPLMNPAHKDGKTNVFLATEDKASRKMMIFGRYGTSEILFSGFMKNEMIVINPCMQDSRYWMPGFNQRMLSDDEVEALPKEEQSRYKCTLKTPTKYDPILEMEVSLGTTTSLNWIQRTGIVLCYNDKIGYFVVRPYMLPVTKLDELYLFTGTERHPPIDSFWDEGNVYISYNFVYYPPEFYEEYRINDHWINVYVKQPCAAGFDIRRMDSRTHIGKIINNIAHFWRYEVANIGPSINNGRLIAIKHDNLDNLGDNNAYYHIIRPKFGGNQQITIESVQGEQIHINQTLEHTIDSDGGRRSILYEATHPILFNGIGDAVFSVTSRGEAYDLKDHDWYGNVNKAILQGESTGYFTFLGEQLDTSFYNKIDAVSIKVSSDPDIYEGHYSEEFLSYAFCFAEPIAQFIVYMKLKGQPYEPPFDPNTGGVSLIHNGIVTAELIVKSGNGDRIVVDSVTLTDCYSESTKVFNSRTYVVFDFQQRTESRVDSYFTAGMSHIDDWWAFGASALHDYAGLNTNRILNTYKMQGYHAPLDHLDSYWMFGVPGTDFAKIFYYRISQNRKVAMIYLKDFHDNYHNFFIIDGAIVEKREIQKIAGFYGITDFIFK